MNADPDATARSTDRHCGHCGRPAPPTARFCTGCGTVLAPGPAGPATAPDTLDPRPRAARSCRGCSGPVQPDDRHCVRCGCLLDPSRDAERIRPEGWYGDPFGSFPYRWWDGTTWSAYATDGAASGHSVWDPLRLDEELRPRSPGLPAVGIAVLGVGIGVALSVAVDVGLRALGPIDRAPSLVLIQLGLWTGLVAACVFVSRRRGRGSLTRDFGLRIRPIDVVFGLAAAIAARLVAGFMLVPVVALFPDLSSPGQQVLGDRSPDTLAWIALGLVVVVGAPLVEELFFRGLLQTRLVGRWGPVTGIVVTSLLFGAVHLIGWAGWVSLAYAWSIAGSGLVLGTVAWLTGRLGPAIAAHCFFNAQALLVLILA